MTKRPARRATRASHTPEVEIAYAFGFDAAHYFTTTPRGHKYRGVHGHSFQCQVTLRGTPHAPHVGAVTTMPPRARLSFVKTRAEGIGQMPIATGWQPAARRPEKTAFMSISPDGLASRPTTTFPLPTYVPKAAANRAASWGVKLSPTTPRTPEMLILSDNLLFMACLRRAAR